MKKLIFFFVMLTLPLSCNDNTTTNNNNPNLPNYSFSFSVDMNLATNASLAFAGNGVKISQSGVGILGIFVFNTGNGFTAWDTACPNQTLGNCSDMILSGINAKCSCDSKLYSLYTGQSTGMQYPMKQYRTEVNGNIIRVYN